MKRRIKKKERKNYDAEVGISAQINVFEEKKATDREGKRAKSHNKEQRTKSIHCSAVFTKYFNSDQSTSTPTMKKKNEWNDE